MTCSRMSSIVFAMIGFRASETGRQLSFKYWLVLSSVGRFDRDSESVSARRKVVASRSTPSGNRTRELTENFDAFEQIVEPKLQSADRVVDFRASDIVEDVSLSLVQVRLRMHYDVHVLCGAGIRLRLAHSVPPRHEVQSEKLKVTSSRTRHSDVSHAISIRCF